MSPSERFAALFTELSPRVHAYALRHCEPTAAEDVVAETFLVAWRRLADVPDDPLPWLLVVARNTIANRRRALARGARQLAEVEGLARVAGSVPSTEQAVVDRDTMLRALAELTAVEREALLLVAWDGLRPRAAATVAGCSLRAFEVRLHRARARLTRLLDLPEPTLGTAVPHPAEVIR